MLQQDNHEYTFLYQRQTCHQVHSNLATYPNREMCTLSLHDALPICLSKVPIVVSATLEKPLSSGAKRFDVSITIVYYFQRYRSEEHTSELQSRFELVCRLLPENSLNAAAR